jgi:hypothetical protein
MTMNDETGHERDLDLVGRQTPMAGQPKPAQPHLILRPRSGLLLICYIFTHVAFYFEPN